MLGLAVLALPAPLQAQPAPAYPVPPGDPPYDYDLPREPYPPPAYYPPPVAYPPPMAYPPGNAALPIAPSDPSVAAGTPPPAAAPRAFGFGATLATNIESGAGSTSVVTAPLLRVVYAAHPQVLLDLTVGFGWLVDNQGLGESTLRAGNPQLSGVYHATRGPWSVAVGLGVTAPLAHQSLGPDGRLYAMLYNRTLAMWGMWNQWQWLPDRLSVPAFVRVSYTFANGIALVAQHADAVMFGQRDASGTDLVGQVAFEAQIPTGAVLTLCPRWQTVLLPAAGIDRWQSAVGLRALFPTGIGRMFVGFLVNLDEPIAAQPGLDRWGFHVGRELSL